MRIPAPLCLLTLLLPGACAVAPSAGGSDPAVAIVNGERIPRSRLLAGVPERADVPDLEGKIQAKRERLIDLTLRLQLLRSFGIRVPDDEVQDIVKEHEASPPPAPCGCCFYDSLPGYLAVNLMEMDEYRESIRANLGLRRLVRRKWREKFAGEVELDAEIERQRERISSEYFKVSEIRFIRSEEHGDVAPMAEAKDMWEVLRKGGDFHALARTHSDNKVTGKSGGRMGCLLKLHFRPDHRSALEALGPGQFTSPLPCFDGAVIYMRHPFERDDLAGVLWEEFDRKTYLTLLRRLEREAKIERK